MNLTGIGGNASGPLIRATRSGHGELGKPRATILQSVVHMHCNRLAGSDRSVEERAVGLLLRTRESLRQAPL